MNFKAPASPVKARIGGKNEAAIAFGFAAVLLFFVLSGVVSYLNISTLNRNSDLVVHTHEVLSAIDILQSQMKDAETGQRGFLLTGQEKYLAPYNAALPVVEDTIESLKKLTVDNPAQQTRIASMQSNIKIKLAELAQTIIIRREKGFDAAVAVVLTDRGKIAMDQVRDIANNMEREEDRLRDLRIAEMADAFRVAIGSGILTGLLGALMATGVAILVRRSSITRRRQEWLQSGELGLAAVISGERDVTMLGEGILKFLAGYLDAQAGAFFSKKGGKFQRVATFGVPSDATIPESINYGDGLLGQAAKDNSTFVVRDVPDGYLTVGSALGHAAPRNLVISAASSDGIVDGVLELGFVHPLNDLSLELLQRASESIGVSIRSANYRSHLQDLLEETQRQSEELQTQSEELRVSNEELEEQSRALKETQGRLEQQHAELEQTNSQLEEQTQLLEIQRDDVARAKNAVQVKAEELEQASQYKSDFLANMSHELRTPLNSSLILAKLLADNKQGNLTDEQVKYAQTIQSSGNDLLTLINDILDLSKIEAGHMEINAEQASIPRLLDDLSRTFLPFAQQKGLAFNCVVSPGCPSMLTTDRQRLEQVLKNLLSNAFKFTENGQVTVSVSARGEGHIAFAVTDSGIGISKEQQQAVFDAFRQADGTISRRYGGTGLGLSICRQLTRLLGGTIELASEMGKGSTFTIVVPAVYQAPLPLHRPEIRTEAIAEMKKDEAPLPHRHIARIPDDREALSGARRAILVIEDDESFARILYDLAHELDFQCLIATHADEALVVAQQYLPSAVILDIGLPDHSGLSVLDRLKRDTRTRHIPVHVVSAGDYAQTAMELGAVGYMPKPVLRSELSRVLRQLEEKLEKRLRRVLIVEDDKVQLDSVSRLLKSHDVETVGASTAAECLELLKESIFDCMVLDLSLPDASGYSLLETLSKEDAYSFPPVIVYTGKDLTLDEEHRLRKYSKSIIIKGAKSPERLLDEVTLFLHQVVSELPPEQQKMIQLARNRDAALEGRRILIVEDDIRNIYAVTNIFEPHGVTVNIARNGVEALSMLEKASHTPDNAIDLVLMDVMMPVMDGLTATREIRKHPEWKKLPIIMLTAKAMKDDQERCLNAGANDYMAKPLDVEKLLSLVRVWMPR
ncbi:MAG: response regulator [Micavibrio sp.]|nr:response regulator [Micavibrio sp.]